MDSQSRLEDRPISAGWMSCEYTSPPTYIFGPLQRRSEDSIEFDFLLKAFCYNLCLYASFFVEIAVVVTLRG